MSTLLVFMYFVSACLVGIIIARAIAHSAFGVLLASTLVWFLIGACAYPMFYLFGAVELHGETADFISRNGEPGLAAGLHILLTAAGMFAGYMYRPRNGGIAGRVARSVAAQLARTDNAIVWRSSVLLGIGAYLIYFQLVGFDVALMNAAAARGGDFEGFGEKESFLFIKTVAALGLVATGFFPIALFEKSKVFIAMYLVLVLTAYANSISRNVILTAVIVPVFVYLRLRYDLKRKGTIRIVVLAGLAMIPLALFVLTYGKLIGQVIRAYFAGEYYSLEEQSGDLSALQVILNNFGFQWASVQAGIDHFSRTGFPLIPKEHFLAAIFGPIPSRVLSGLGLEFLYYGNVKPTLACINSTAFGYTDCIVPPLAVGYSAYLLPGVGGFLVGFVMLRGCAALERLWLTIQQGDWRKLWIPYFLFGAMVTFFSFIPPAIALACGQVLWVFALTRIRRKKATPYHWATAR